MKKLFCLAAIALALPLSSFAQQDTNSLPSFFDTLTSYFSSFNTNLDSTFATARGSVTVGADYVSGVNTASSFSLEYNLPKNFSVESTTRNAGIAGVILSEQAGFGYNIIVHDTKLTAYIDGGYDFDHTRGFAAIGARVKKALTTHTFAGIGIETQLANRTVTPPVVSIFTGFTF